jgi:hypothetical protein
MGRKKLRISKICEYCSNSYIPESKRVGPKVIAKRRFCSKHCSALAHKELNIKLGKMVGLSPRTKEWKEKHSKRMMGSKLHLGYKHSEETKRKISIVHRGIKMKEDWEYVSSKDKLERNRFRSQIQKQVFKRDNYTCQICGKRGGNIQVDHIQPWAEYVELRFCIDNCRTLCVKCHYKITFGKPMPPNIRAWGHNMKQLQGGTNL